MAQSDPPADRDRPEAADADPPAGQDNPAERIIARFGGIRPMAHKLNVPVTTVQGWKKRGAIPEVRHDDIRAAAVAHGIELDPADLAAALPEPTEGDYPEDGAEEGRATRPEAAPAAPPPAPPPGPKPPGPEPVEPEPVEPEPVEPGRTAAEIAEDEARAGESPAAPEEERAAAAAGEVPPSREEQAAEAPDGDERRAEAEEEAATTRPWGAGPARDAPERRATHDEAAEEEEPVAPSHAAYGEPAGPQRRGAGGGGGGGAVLLALLALLVAAAAIAMPWWMPRYLPDYWPGPSESAFQDVQNRVAQVQGRVDDLSGTVEQAPSGEQVAQMRERVDELANQVQQLQAGPGAEQTAALTQRVDELASQVQQLRAGADGEQAAVLAEQLGRLQQEVNQAVGETETLAQRIQTLRDQLGQGGTVADLAGLEQRLATLEQASGTGAAGADLAALQQELVSLRESLADLPERLSALEAGPGPEALRGQITAMTGRIDQLESSLEEAGQRLTAVAQEAEQRQQREAREEALAVAASQLRRDLNIGAAYAVSLAAVLSLIEGDQDLSVVLRPLQERANTGIPTETELARRFSEMAERVREAATQPDSDAWWARALNRMENLVSVRPAPGEVEGDDPGAVLARAEYRLNNGDLAGAAEAVAQLSGAPAEAAEPWLNDARARLAAGAAIELLDAAAIERLTGGATAAAAPDGSAGQGEEATP